ncbi:MAG: ATP-binding cassette domain-containing protein [Thiobacillus sp.]|nr:ATP-binding cassette domain-containing protein [Thiobacillus sp.]
MADAHTLVEIRDGGFAYKAGHWLFHQLYLHLEEGQVGMILGPNGSGKTTLMRCLVGDARLRAGTITCPRRLGYVPQTLALTFDFAVRDIVVMGRVRHISLLGTPNAEDWQHVDRALETVGMRAFAERSFLSLSGGEKQLVLIARALAGGNQLLLLDEPTAALDIANQDRVLQVLWHLRAQEDTTILMSTHDPQHAADLADVVLLMNRDGTSAFGPTETLLTESKLSALYGVPMRRHEAAVNGGPPHVLLAPVSHHYREVGVQ